VFCTKREAVVTNVFVTEEEAVGAWNTRTPTGKGKN
jgi:hypothetical protein